VRIFNDPLLGDRLMMETIGKGRSLYERINFYAAQNNLEKMSKIYNKAITLVKAKESVEAKQTAEEGIDWFPSWSNRDAWSNRDDEESSSSDEADFMNSPIYPGSPNWDMVMNLVNGTHEVSKQIPSALQAQLNVDNSREEPEEIILPHVENTTDENPNKTLAEELKKYRNGIYGDSISGFDDEDFDASQFEFSQANSALGTNGETDLEKYNRLKPISKYEMPQGFTQKVINIQNEIRSAKAFITKYKITQQMKANHQNDALKKVTMLETKDWVAREKARAAEAGFESSINSSWAESSYNYENN
jgi:hypothetical protein